MNTSGEAADQVVRMSLEVGEAALKITGAGAKQLAVLLYAVLKEQKKTKGRARLETLVRSGKPLTVYSVKESDLKQFVTEAKRYGILYCAVRNPKGSIDGMLMWWSRKRTLPGSTGSWSGSSLLLLQKRLRSRQRSKRAERKNPTGRAGRHLL